MMTSNVHPFPARMAPEIAIRYLEHVKGFEGARPLIADPMCGSGTVLVEAARRGYDAVGVDMDPLAVLMSSVASRQIDVCALADSARAAVREARALPETPRLWNDDETEDFARFWFGDKQRDQLARLSIALSRIDSIEVREALQIALSRIIDTKSPKASLASDTSHSRPHRTVRASDHDYDVYDGFLKSTKQLGRFFDKRELSGDVAVKCGDARNLELSDDCVDAIITSPPYLNAIDYMRGHRLSLVWLGYSIPLLREIRSNSIGSERALTGDAAHGANRLVAFVENDEENVPNPDLLPRKALLRYASDLTLIACEMKRVARPGACVITVVGNSTLKGNFIRNADMMALALAGAGISVKSRSVREIPDSARYLPIKSSQTLSRRMREEVVLVAKA